MLGAMVAGRFSRLCRCGFFVTWILHLFIGKYINFTYSQAILKKSSRNILAKVSQDKRGAGRDLKKN
jgi:hypothetical protein